MAEKRAGIIHQVKRVSLPCLPLAGYQQNNIFKIYAPDIGLLSARAGPEMRAYIGTDAKVFHHYKGALSEQFALQELRATTSNLPLYYWANDKNTAEVDFVIQFQDMIIPIEIKSGENIKSSSLKSFMSAFEPTTAIRASLLDYGKNGALIDLPLYMISEFAEIVGR
jgi:predicted AAA+ superfamily ATPase